MADSNEDNVESKQNESQPFIPTTVDNTIDDSIEENERTQSAENKSKGNCNSPQPFIVKMEKNKGWSRQEITSIVAIAFSFITIIMTVRSFMKTSEAVAISEASLLDTRKKDSLNTRKSKTADSLTDIQYKRMVRNDSINYAKDTSSFNLAKRDFEERVEKDKLNTSLTIKSIEAQINSIKEVRKQFETDRKPYLKITDVFFTKFNQNEKPEIKYQLENIGSYPTKIVDFRLSFFYGMAPFSQEDIKRYKIQSENISTYNYMGVGKAIPFNLYPKDIVDSITYVNVTGGFVSPSIIGEITYYNEITGKDRKLRFYIRITPPPTNTFVILYNENFDK